MDAGNDTSNYSSILLPDMLKLAKVGTWEFDIENGLVTGCPLFKKMFDFQEQQIISHHHILNKVARQQRSEFKQAIADTAAGNTLSIEIALRTNKVIWLRITGQLFHSSENDSSKMAGIVEDITKSKAQENAKNNMISYLSHELKSPLTTLKLYIQRSVLLAKENGQDVIANFLRKADDQVSSMNTLTDTYLNQAALENGGFKLDISRFDVTELISEVAANLKFQHPDYDFESKMPAALFLQADRTKIGQAITNLVKNAIKYSSSNSKVTIQCILQAEFALIIIKDRGVGIEKNNLKKLFNRFYRVKGPETRGISGYGIGLHLVKNIVNAHNGQIAVTSNLNKGSEFLFTIPLENLAGNTIHH
jgi:two-component system sensor histidine kinase VicK